MADHGTRPATGAQAGEHGRGEMEIAEHKRMFDAFIKFWVLVFGASAAILIFLALFNS